MLHFLDQKVSANIEMLLSRVRRQAVDIGGQCTDAAMCMAGNGGANSVCVVPPMDEVQLCTCSPGFGINPTCLRKCNTIHLYQIYYKNKYIFINT